MNDFELKLDQLRKLLDDDGSDQKAKKQLVEELILEFEDDAECPLNSFHKTFFKLLAIKDVDDSFKFYAKGVLAYEKNIRSKFPIIQSVLAPKVLPTQPNHFAHQVQQLVIPDNEITPNDSPDGEKNIPVAGKKNKRI